MPNENENHAERISKLETAVGNISLVLEKLERGQKEIGQALEKSNETNWSVIIAALSLIVAFSVLIYGAAVHPLNNEIANEKEARQVLAVGVLEQNKRIDGIESRLVQGLSLQVVHDKAISNIEEHGSANADRRLLLLEYRIDHLTGVK